MKKLTLQFPSLKDLSSFAKSLQRGYIVNTIELTLTASLPDTYLYKAVHQYRAQEVS